MLRRGSGSSSERAADQTSANTALQDAVAELTEAVAELRAALGGGDADTRLRLHRIEQRLARLEDAEAAAPATEPGPAVVPLASPSPERKGGEERYALRAENIAQKLGDRALSMPTERFASACDRPNVSLLGDLDGSGAPVVVQVVEGGDAPMLAPSRLLGHLNDQSRRHVVVRDILHSWLHRGAPGVAGTLDELATTVAAALEQHGGPVAVLGAGPVGFAAILLGAEIGADHVVVVDPLTTIDRALLAELGDGRWDDALSALDTQGGADPGRVDALALLRSGSTPVEIVYSSADPLDRLHAERLNGAADVSLVPSGTADALEWLLADGRIDESLGRATTVRASRSDR